MKKAQGISINVIIVTIIALLVLVILAAIFTGKLTLFNRQVNDCGTLNKATCELGDDCSSKGPGYIKHPTHICYDGKDVDEDSVCCIPLT